MTEASALPVGYNEDPARLSAVPKAVDRSNTQIARVGFFWHTIEPAPDRFDWREPDRVVALLRKLQIRPVITIVGSPPWAAVDNRGVHCAPDRATDPQWHQLWKQAALRYPDAPPQPEIGAYYVPPSACPG